VNEEVIEYSHTIIGRILLNYPDLEAYRFRGDISDGSFGNRLLIIRCDMEMAFEQLDPESKPLAASLFLEGKGAVDTGAVTSLQFRSLVEEMHRILNVEGLY
jgi:hypothetical protein